MTQEVSNTSKVIKGMSSQTIVTLVLGVVEIVSFSVMSRLLTREDFGYYAAISAITTVFASFSETGIGAAIVQQKELTKRFVNNAFTISLLFGGFISLILLVLAGPLSYSIADGSMKFPLMLMSSTLLFNCLSSVNLSIMHRKLQFLRMGLINLISLVVTTVLAIWLAWKGFGYFAIIAKAILGSFITFLLSLFLCNTHFGFAIDGGTFKKIFSFSGWLMASALFRNLAHQVDRLLMPRLLSIDALGAYNRPKDFVEQISSKLNGIFDTALFPVLSGIQDDEISLKTAFRRSLYIMNALALLLTLGLAFNSSLLIRIFFGEQWMYLKTTMMIFSFSLLFNIDGRLADCYLRSLAMTRQQFFFRIFETVLKVLGVIIGCDWGIIGVATSVVVTNFISKIIKILYIGNRIKVTPGECIGIIFSSWRYSLLLLPICLTSFFLLPKTWIGDLLLASIFIIIAFVVFVIKPEIVGKRYQDDIYVQIRFFYDEKIRKNINVFMSRFVNVFNKDRRSH